MLAAVGLLGVRPRLRWAAAVAVVLATAIGLAQWYAPKDGGNWRGEDWRTATHTALELKKPGDDVVVVPWWAYQSAEYYGAQPHDTSTADSIWVAGLVRGPATSCHPPNVRHLASETTCSWRSTGSGGA